MSKMALVYSLADLQLSEQGETQSGVALNVPRGMTFLKAAIIGDIHSFSRIVRLSEEQDEASISKKFIGASVACFDRVVVLITKEGEFTRCGRMYKNILGAFGKPLTATLLDGSTVKHTDPSLPSTMISIDGAIPCSPS